MCIPSAYDDLLNYLKAEVIIQTDLLKCNSIIIDRKNISISAHLSKNALARFTYLPKWVVTHRALTHLKFTHSGILPMLDMRMEIITMQIC